MGLGGGWLLLVGDFSRTRVLGVFFCRFNKCFHVLWSSKGPNWSKLCVRRCFGEYFLKKCLDPWMETRLNPLETVPLRECFENMMPKHFYPDV